MARLRHRLRRAVRELFPPDDHDRLRFVGSFGSWGEASASSTGYDDESILSKVVEANRAVVAGQARYERDSFLFHDDAVPTSVAAIVLRSALHDGGSVRVVDIGGSLGSTYRQTRAFLAPVRHLEWHIVEQAHFVQAGRAEFENDELQFHDSLDEIDIAGTPVTLIMSASLQHMDAPHRWLASLGERPARHLIIDRVPVSSQSEDSLCVQHAPQSVYEASYPMWIFSRNSLREALEPHWALIADEPGRDGSHRTAGGVELCFRSLSWERRP